MTEVGENRMNKYTKILIVLFILGAVIAIMFRPSGKLMSDDSAEDKSYLAVYEEAVSNKRPLFIEFYTRY